MAERRIGLHGILRAKSRFLIGYGGHEEVIGTMGEDPDHITLVDGPEDVEHLQVRDESKVVGLSQTPLSVDETMETVDALKERFPQLISPPDDDICYAAQNRRLAVKETRADADLVIVVGSRDSSNSQRLVVLEDQVPSAAGHPWLPRVPDRRACRGAAAVRPASRTSTERCRAGTGAPRLRTPRKRKPQAEALPETDQLLEGSERRCRSMHLRPCCRG